MSSGWSSYVVESAEARERRLLAEARTRRQGLLEAWAQVAAKQRSLGLAVNDWRVTDGDSTQIRDQCSQLEEIIHQAEKNVRAELSIRERAFAQEQLAAAIADITIDTTLVKELALAREAACKSRPAPPHDTDEARLAALATAVVEHQDVADPELAIQVARALEQSPERARMLLQALRDEVDRRNARHRMAQEEAAREHRRVIDASAEAAAAQEEVRFVENAVRESLRTLGYQTPDAEAAGAEQALVVRSAAHPEHAVLALTESGRIRLDTIRIAGASSPGSDHEADQALCNALAAFRDELEKRGVRTTRVSHLPAGLSPVIRRELKKRSSTMTTAEIRKLQR